MTDIVSLLKFEVRAPVIDSDRASKLEVGPPGGIVADVFESVMPLVLVLDKVGSTITVVSEVFDDNDKLGNEKEEVDVETSIVVVINEDGINVVD